MPLPAPTLLLLLFLPLLVTLAAAVPTPVEDPTHLLAFKSKADLTDSLPYSANSSASYCTWTGVQCTFNHRVTKLVLQNLPLNGVVAPNTVSLLDQLRVLSLQNLSLSGPIPDLSTLPNLKALFLDHNRFTFSVPSSLVSLHRLKTLDLSYNRLSADLPASLVSLRRLTTLDLRFNRFAGPLPAFNQSSLAAFNVSHNNFSGPVPVTPALLRFGASSFRSNPSLCGEIVHRECRPVSPFFAASPPDLAPPPESGGHTSGELHGVGGLDSYLDSNDKSRKKTKALIIGFCSSVGVLILSLLCYITSLRRKSPRHRHPHSPARSVASVAADDAAVAPELTQMELQGSELEEKVKQRLQQRQGETAPATVAVGVIKSGRLLFCAGEAQLYTLDQLMRASAELLGRGTLGTTYKAVLDNRLIVTVKRLDAGKLRSTCGEVFERHMESVGGLRHPNLVPLRAYFQGKEERLLVYDYHPNGSLLSLIHGSKSNRAKPLHWTSCLKIAEDIAQGLSYIHQAWRLVHGNLRSSNVLLGPDFEACVSDYCLSILAQDPHGADHLDPDAAAYKAPEITSTAHDQPTSKSDVYSFGILLLELVTGKPPSQLPDLAPGEMVKWVRFVREEGDAGGEGGGNDPLEMLLEVAMACSLASPEQRPTMWQVLKMLQEVKEAVVLDDSEVSILEQRDNSTGLS